MRSPLGPGITILGSLAIIMILFLLIGLLLPGTWRAEASARIPASPEEIFLYLDSPAEWNQWTTLPATGVRIVGTPSGEGSGFIWDDPELGSGAFTIIEAREPELIRYQVRMQNGAMQIDGALQLSPEKGGARILWTESGNLGANPLMGYWALSMNRMQTAELEKSLDRLLGIVLNVTDSIDSVPNR